MDSCPSGSRLILFGLGRQMRLGYKGLRMASLIAFCRDSPSSLDGPAT